MHVFCHRSTPYAFVDGGESDWMSPSLLLRRHDASDELALRFQADLHFVELWRWDGRHYEKTCQCLAGQSRRSARQLSCPYSRAPTARRTLPCGCRRWRVFFMALCRVVRLSQWPGVVGQPLPVRTVPPRDQSAHHGQHRCLPMRMVCLRAGCSGAATRTRLAGGSRSGVLALAYGDIALARASDWWSWQLQSARHLSPCWPPVAGCACNHC